METTYILGCGAVKDTYNLLADGIVKLMRALAVVGGCAGAALDRGQRLQTLRGL